MANGVIVTGASGFIGTHLCAALAQAGWRVRGMDRNDPPGPFAGEFNRVDIVDSPKLAALCAGATRVVHLAALASVEDSTRDPQRARRDTVESTRRMLQACGPGTRFVLASAAAVYSHTAPVPQRENATGAATNVYAGAKLEAESLVRSSPVEGVCLRLFNVYGPGQRAGIIARIVDCSRHGRTLRIQGDGEQTRDFLHVRDAVNAFELALGFEPDRGGQAINIGSGDEISINALVRLAVEVGGRPIEVEYTAARPGDLRRSCADIRRANQAFGFKAKVGLAAGLEELFAAE